MKKIIIFIMSNFIVFFNYGASIKDYQSELVAILPNGYEEGMLNYSEGILPSGPTCFEIVNDIVYIPDTLNSRIALFELNNFSFIKNIDFNLNKNKDISFFPEAIRIDEGNNIYIYGRTNGILKINNQGVGEYLLGIDKLEINIFHFHDRFYPIGEYLFYYNKNEKIIALSNNGTVIDTIKARDILENDGMYKGFINENDKLFTAFQGFINNNNLLYLNGKLLTNDIGDFIKYQYFCNQYKRQLNLKDKILINIEDLYPVTYIGTDQKRNYYWYSYDKIIVYSRYTEIIDVFNNRMKYHLKAAIAPNGDIYYMTRNDSDTKFLFYRIKNTWDPIDSPGTTTQSTEPIVTSLTASSYNHYKNMYTPLKAFDGDIKTAWLEAAKGPGIGETITLELDREITIDSIQVLPGLFDAKWWKANNRVKSLIMKTDDSTTTLQFQDTMKPHKADFKEPKTFKKVEFIIKEVYPSGKDDDTAISEIQFYYKGDRIRLDFSKQEVK